MSETAEQTQVQLIDVECLIPTPDNPRRIRTNDPAVKELAESIRAIGVLQPVIARPFPMGIVPAKHWPQWAAQKFAHGRDCYDLRAGHRRLLAAMQAGLTVIPTIIRDMDDKTAMEITVAENMQREDLTPLEESEGVQHLLDVGWDVQAIADRLGKTASWVARRARLVELSDTWRKAAEEHPAVKPWTASHLELVARLPEESQDALYEHMFVKNGIAYDWEEGYYEVHTATELQRIIGDLLRTLKGAPFSLDDETLSPKAGPCTSCSKRSSVQPLLWGDAEDNGKPIGDRCLDRACFDAKVRAHVQRKLEQLQAKGQKPVGIYEGYDPEAKQAAAETHGIPVLSSYQVNTAKKSNPKAKPAVVLSGPGAGTVKWVTTDGGGSVSSRKAARPKGTPTPLAERRKQLARRRYAMVIEIIRERLDDIQNQAVPDWSREPFSVLKAVRAFGLARCESQDLRYGACLNACWKTLAKTKKAKVEDVAGELFAEVCKVLGRRIVIHDGEMAEKAWPEIERICKLLDWDLAELERQATEAIPEPKGWASLNANGTPKKPAAKRARKPAEAETSSTPASETLPPAKKRARTKAKKRAKKDREASLCSACVGAE